MEPPNAINTGKLDAVSKVVASEPSEEDCSKKNSLEDTLIDGLGSISSFFDELYLLKSFGVISEDNFLYRKLNKGDIGSKVWLASLILSVRRSLTNLYRALKTKWTLRRECAGLASSSCHELKKILMDKYTAKNREVDSKISSLLMDIFQDAVYIIIILVDLLKINLSRKVRKMLEYLSSFSTLLKFFHNAYSLNM